MKNSKKLLAVLVAASALFGSSSAYGASLEKDAVIGSNDQILTNVNTLAGLGGFGDYNGARLTATFRSPAGLGLLPDGTILFADSRNHKIKQLKDGKVSDFAGIYVHKDAKGFPEGGMLDEKKDLSLFNEPKGIAVDANGNIYVADAGNHAVRKIDASGKVTTVAGTGVLGHKDGAGKEARLYYPTDVAVAADGTIYVTDSLNHVIRSITPAGQVKTLNALSNRLIEVSPGQVVPAGDYSDGSLATAKFNEPTSLVLDAKGNLYVSDTGNQRIRYIDLAQGKVSTVAGSSVNEAKSGLYEKKELFAPGDYADGEALKALFNAPQGLALTAEGGLLIADSGNNAVRYLANGKVTTLAGASNLLSGELDGIDRGAGFHKPTDVAVLADGSVVVADSFNNKLRSVSLYQLPAELPKDDSVKVVLGSQWVQFDAQPEISEGRTMVPVRLITEALGYKVTFDDDTRAVQLSKDGRTIELYVGKTGIKRLEEGKEAVQKATDVAPYIKEDRTYVPIRFFAEEIGLDVQWHNDTRTAIIREKTTIKP
ncbi:stalk domain-containing protein [Paenibacillus silviterrae]|uniref:stalk domain-containing protein n=1 Tax=Paenibacillus silviterrae TaxID=3242194 RepID=UPI002543F7D5|nr:stalk domain-containing protein [Paenibacillus chinjuensis]